jgi:hypothetical protein
MTEYPLTSLTSGLRRLLSSTNDCSSETRRLWSYRTGLGCQRDCDCVFHGHEPRAAIGRGRTMADGHLDDLGIRQSSSFNTTSDQ